MDFSEFLFIAPPQNHNDHETPQEIDHLNGYAGNHLQKQKLSRKQLVVNILLLSFFSVTAGWFGVFMKSLTGQTNLALLVFLAVPPMGVLILNLVNKKSELNPGLRINLKRSGGSYALSLLLIPGLAVILLAIGKLGGWISMDGLADRGFGALINTILLGFFSNLIKNCLEEFTWRGFFTQHFKSLGTPDLLNHLFTGIIWSLWHLPYWLFLLDKASISAFSPLDSTAFVITGSLFLVALSFVFGEIRLLTNSIWPVVLLHSSLNAVTITLLLKGFVTVKSSAALWLSPGGNSIVFMLLLLIVGLVLYRIRSLKPKK
jgi:membrane protease YdiL (CAAX protease family)